MTIYDYGSSPEQWLRAADIATRSIKYRDPNELAADTWCWMEANDFDIAFISGDEIQIVRKERIASADSKSLLAEFLETLPAEHCGLPSMTLQDAFGKLSSLSWLVLRDESKLLGVVTFDDLAKPAASAFVLAQLINLERVLRRLWGTYQNRPISDEPLNARALNAANKDPVEYLSKVINQCEKIRPLLKDLGYSRSEFEDIGSWAIEFRNHLAHSRRFNDRPKSVPPPLTRFFEIQRLMLRCVELVQDRPQIWTAIGKAVISDAASQRILAGPGAAIEFDSFPGFVITAANPYEQGLSSKANQRRNAMLKQVLMRRTDQILEVVGASPCNTWQENSFLVTGMCQPDILKLAKDYGQRAVFLLTSTEKLAIDTDGNVRSRSSRFE